MAAQEDQYVTNGDHEEASAKPSRAEETVEGGNPLEDSPLIPGGATADTKKNLADPDDDPASTDR